MKRSSFRLFTVWLPIFAVAIFPGSVHAQNPPSVEYEITWIGDDQGETWGLAINSAGAVVGQFEDENGDRHAFVWQPTTGILDLNVIATVPAGWRLNQARGINDSGQIAGNATNLTTGQIVAFRYDPITGSAELMTIFDSVDHRCAWGNPINEGGEVAYNAELPDGWHSFLDSPDRGFFDVVVPNENYSVNDIGQVSGYAFLLSLGNSPNDSHLIESFPDLQRLWDINNSGVFVGDASKRGRYNLKAFRYDLLLEEPQFLDSEKAESRANSINSSNDVSVTSNGSSFLYMDQYGLLNLDSLVDNPSNDTTLWFQANNVNATSISDRDATGFGLVCGYVNSGNGIKVSFLLTPTVPGQTPGITVNPNNGLVTTEAGGTDTFTVALNTQPAADVTIGISSSNSAAGTVSPAILTFDGTNWNDAQTVTITGVNDSLEFDVIYTIITDPAESLDPDYDTLNADDVQVTNQDDDAPTGGGTTTYSSGNIGLTIPDNDSGGIDSMIGVGAGEAVQIVSLTVTLNISHPRPSDLSRVYLTGPDGTEVDLTNFTGDNAVTAFNGTSSLGIWTLTAIDTKKKKVGKINSWTIKADY